MDDAAQGPENRPPLAEMVTYRLSRLHARLNAQAARILKDSAGISLMQWRVLVMIEGHRRISPAEIVRRTSLDKGQISRAVKSMIADGLVKTEISDTDHRSHLIEFTDKGFALFELARPRMRGRQARLMGSLDDAGRRALFEAFEKLEAEMEALDAEATGWNPA